MIIKSVDHESRNYAAMQSWHKWWAIVPIRVSETEVVVDDWVWRKAQYAYNRPWSPSNPDGLGFTFSYCKWTKDNFAAADYKTNHYCRHPATTAIAPEDLTKFADPNYFPGVLTRKITTKSRSLWSWVRSFFHAPA